MDEDAPTRILKGSHHSDTPTSPAFREDGVIGLSRAVADPPGTVVSATGLAGDVYLCHPFLVHAASWPHLGLRPRLIAQPPIALEGGLRLQIAEQKLSPVALTVRRALDS